MKKILYTIALATVFVACKKDVKSAEAEVEKVQDSVSYASFGKEIVADDALIAESMAKHYKTMAVGDSIDSKMTAKVKEVCQMKGCWMTLEMPDSTEVMVRFKDYAFFVPMNISGQEVVVNGKAFVKETSVEELRHYAEDGGKSEEEIAAITEPKRTFSFLADGVLVKE